MGYPLCLSSPAHLHSSAHPKVSPSAHRSFQALPACPAVCHRESQKVPLPGVNGFMLHSSPISPRALRGHIVSLLLGSPSPGPVVLLSPSDQLFLPNPPLLLLTPGPCPCCSLSLVRHNALPSPQLSQALLPLPGKAALYVCDTYNVMCMYHKHTYKHRHTDTHTHTSTELSPPDHQTQWISHF